MTTTRSWARGGALAESAWAPGRADDLATLLVRGGATVAAAAALGCGTVLVVRRLAAGIVAPSPAALGAAVAAGLVLVAVADLARRDGGRLLASVIARCGLVLAVAALALPPPATGPAGRILVALALAAAAVAIVRLPRRRGDRGTRAWPGAPFRGGRRPAPVSPRSAPNSPHHDPAPPRPVPALEPRHAADDGRLWQVFERRELPPGTDRVRGRVHVSIPAGAKLGHGHVGFCPAFAQTPQVAVSTDYDGVEATIVAAEVLPWGVRVECRLAEPAEEPVEIPVDLHAEAPA